MYHKPKCKTYDYKISRKKMEEEFCDLSLGKKKFKCNTKSMSHKNQIHKLEYQN